MARVFMSTLGTNKYTLCHYKLGDNTSKLVAFIQEALVSLLCKDWTQEDRIVVFCTEEAEECNWRNGGNFPEGLESRLKKMNLQPSIKMVPIPDGKSEEEIMEIFEKMVGELKDGDEVVLDITHSFRSIPMLATVVLNYAKILKNISVKGIYYGAFDVLGPQKKVEKMDEAKRIAPIFNLTPFDELLDWGSAINTFLKSGNAEEIQKLTAKRVGHLFKTGQGTDTAKKLRGFANQLKSFCSDLTAARGRQIYEKAGNSGFATTIADLEKEAEVAPVKPLLELLRPKLEPFDTGSGMKVSIEAVKWCIEHGLIPQAYILLYELCLTELCRSYGLNPMDRADREFVSSLVHVVAQNKPEPEWKGEISRRKNLARKIVETGGEKLKELFKTIQDLGNRRNDFMHGGWREDSTDATKLVRKILSIMETIPSVLEEYTTDAAKKAIFVISHEPSPEQIQELKTKWNAREIVKMPEDIAARWRSIPPNAESIEKEILPVKKWIDEICKPGDLVIIQGDYGASFMLAGYVKEIGNVPLYATTERKVEENIADDGSVEQRRLFRHVRFRKYEFLTD